jgi:cellulose synthase/poly-beta-1,6-N-acetylglucosamine synthase-like glycosyltransferase
MEFLTILYLTYTFIAFYFLSLHILIFIQNKSQVYNAPKYKKVKSLSLILPCYNEEKEIGKFIENILKTDYPGLKKVIIVDDCSKDNSFKIIKQYAKKHKIIEAYQMPKNSGRAAGPKNFGLKYADTELVAFSDSDSYPSPNAISKMVGFLEEEGVGAVTSRVFVKNHNKNFLTKAQSIEYKVIAFTRKLFEFIESIYVTNGPLSIYKKEVLEKTGGFDMKNLTEDIELTWNAVSHGYKIRMCMPAVVKSEVPETIKMWFKQRIRWNVGGIQTVAKYRKKIAKCGMLGYFIIPFFVFSWFLGITGLFYLTYRFTNAVISKFLVAKYSVAAEVALIQMDDFVLNPSILFYFGMLLFSLGLAYTFTALFHSRGEFKLIGHKVRDIFIYSIFYLLMYPPLLIWSFYKFSRGYNEWGTR